MEASIEVITKLKIDQTNEFIRALKGKKAMGSLEGYRIILQKFMEYFKQHTNELDIVILVDHYLQYLYSDLKREPNTINHIFFTINKYVRWATGFDICQTKRIELYRVPDDEPDYRSLDDLIKLFGVIEELQDKVITAILIFTGARIGEVLQLKWKNMLNVVLS